MRTLRIAFASLLLVAGCSTIESGEPKAIDDPATETGEPTGTAEPTTESGEPTSSTTEGPKRPKDIDVSAIDPCTVVKKLPTRSYGLDGKPYGGKGYVSPGAKDCGVTGFDTNVSLLITLVPDMGASEYIEAEPAKLTEYDAQGFPLSVLDRQRLPLTCLGALDVHDGQFILITYGASSEDRQPRMPKAKACTTVTMIAASVVSALG
jgi:hypothetical protein